MRLLLEDAGHQVTVTESGQKGIEIAEAEQPDMVLLDVVLPDLDGFSVCHRNPAGIDPDVAGLRVSD